MNKMLTTLAILLVGLKVTLSYKIEGNQDAGRNIFKPKQGRGTSNSSTL